jgi:polyphosphate kinase 2 (PPK2 family)
VEAIRKISESSLERLRGQWPAAFIFDRSWYNRAGVERVMGFCSEEQAAEFLKHVPPMDLPSRQRWYDYSRARDSMLDATDTDASPWHIVRSDDKTRARLNCIADILSRIPYGADQARQSQAAQTLR